MAPTTPSTEMGAKDMTNIKNMAKMKYMAKIRTYGQNTTKMADFVAAGGEGTDRLSVLEQGTPAAAKGHPPLVAEEGVIGPVVRAVAVLP